jgi:histidinol-phosphate aminotransferase
MHRLVADHIERLVPYSPGKPIEELERELGIKDAIKLASNECPLGPSPKVTEAIARAAKDAHLYPDSGGFALKADLAAAHGVEMSEICIGNGSNELIDLLCRTFATHDEHAVFGDPSFVCYRLGCISANVPFTEVPLRERLHWDVDALLDAIRPNTKLLFLANPNNPTGSYLGRPALERLLREAPEDVIVVLDEAYTDFADRSDYASALAMRDLRERLVVLRTFSKAYGIAALRVGYAIAPPPIVDYLNRVRAPFNVGALGQVAARAALADQGWVDEYVAMNRIEREKLTKSLGHLGLAVAPSQANFVLVDFGRPGREIYDRLLRKGVIVRPMPPPIETWLRITVGTPDQNERLVAAVKELANA